MSGDPLNELLGIDLADPLQNLACLLVASDDSLMTALREHRLLRTTLSVAEVARRMGTKPSAVMALELPGADPKLSTVRRYALAIGALVKHEVTTPPKALSAASTEGDD